MLARGQIIVVLRKGKEYEGVVFGSEEDLFWLLVHELDEVHRGHSEQVFSHSGRMYLQAAEWIHRVACMFDTSGRFSSTAFHHTENSEEMVKYLQTYRLLTPGAI